MSETENKIKPDIIFVLKSIGCHELAHLVQYSIVAVSALELLKFVLDAIDLMINQHSLSNTEKLNMAHALLKTRAKYLFIGGSAGGVIGYLLEANVVSVIVGALIGAFLGEKVYEHKFASDIETVWKSAKIDFTGFMSCDNLRGVYKIVSKAIVSLVTKKLKN